MNPKDPVALNLITQKDLIDALEKAQKKSKKRKKEKEKKSEIRSKCILMDKNNRHKFIKVLISRLFGGFY